MRDRMAESTPTPLLYPSGERYTEFVDDDGRKLAKGDFIRTTRFPRSWLFKIRHLFRSPNGTAWIDAYGPYDRFGNTFTNSKTRNPLYRSFRTDEVAAKARVNQK